MKAKLVSELPAGPTWLYELKLDGYRCSALKQGDRVQIISSRGNDLTQTFPQVASAVSTLKAKTVVLDGEIVAVDPQGKHSFSALQGRGTVPKGWHIVFYAFDLLHLNGQDLSSWPLVKRKAALEKVLAGSTVLFCPELVGDPEDIIASVKSLGLEGIVAKRRESTYQSGDRSGAWLKYKTSPAQEFVIGGFKSDGKSFESLLVGCSEGKKLKFAGKVRAGFRPHNRKQLWQRLKPLVQGVCPFDQLKISKSSRWSGGVTEEDLAVVKWVKPKLVVQVSFVEWPKDGLLRHPTFLGIREDKTAWEVSREVPA